MCAITSREQGTGGEEDGENTGLVMSFWAMFAEGRLAEVCVEEPGPHRARITAQPGDEVISAEATKSGSRGRAPRLATRAR